MSSCLRLTDGQLMALADLLDGKWKYGISLRTRHSLPSLVKRGFVAQYMSEGSADQWCITLEGKAAFSQAGTVRHLPAPQLSSQDGDSRFPDGIKNAAPANRSTAKATARVGDDRESMGSEPSMGIVTGGSDPTQSLSRPQHSTPEK